MIASVFDPYFSVEYLAPVDYFHGFAYLLTILALLYIGKHLFALAAPYRLNQELTQKDNKAVAVSFSGYMFGLGMILQGVLSGEPQDVIWKDIGNTAAWGAIGMILLLVAQRVNDKIIFSAFSNRKELAEDRNIGLGAAEAGSFVGTALMVRACVSGEGYGWEAGLIGTGLFFICGQIAFIGFAQVYQLITKYDFKKELEENDNVAIGVSFGLCLTAFGNLLAGSILNSDSIPFFAIWAISGAVALAVSRFVLDKFILPGAKLDEEIHRDHNWGAALLIGSLFVVISFLIRSSFL